MTVGHASCIYVYLCIFMFILQPLTSLLTFLFGSVNYFMRMYIGNIYSNIIYFGYARCVFLPFIIYCLLFTCIAT